MELIAPTIIITAFAFLLHLVEAYYESDVGDRKHWISTLLNFLIFVGFWLLIQGKYSDLISWFLARTWFDYFYNYFEGHKRSYLGEVAKTDQKLKKFGYRYILSARIIFSLICILILIIF